MFKTSVPPTAFTTSLILFNTSFVALTLVIVGSLYASVLIVVS
ncbi:MAG: hypothetical protein RSF67_08490 [Clostridia bacterium]